MNIAKMGTLDFTITSDQLVNGDTMAVFNGAQFTLSIDGVAYGIESTATVSADGTTVYGQLADERPLKAALDAYWNGATSASKAGTADLAVSCSVTDYIFSATSPPSCFRR